MDEILKAKRQQSASSLRAITIRGAREHNLKNIDVEIPRDKLAVFTGLSGSGKSSLAFDTIYAEGQRRYVESLSAYARQFLERMEKPDVDRIDGISPAIAIRQKNSIRNPRSTDEYGFFQGMFQERRASGPPSSLIIPLIVKTKKRSV